MAKKEPDGAFITFSEEMRHSILLLSDRELEETVFLAYADDDHEKAARVLKELTTVRVWLNYRARHGLPNVPPRAKGLLETAANMSCTPPSWANFLLFCFLNKKDRQSIIGDLQEEYETEVLPQFGPRQAWFWYWSRALSAAAYRNPICRWLLIGGAVFNVGEWIVRKIGS